MVFIIDKFVYGILWKVLYFSDFFFMWFCTETSRNLFFCLVKKYNWHMGYVAKAINDILIGKKIITSNNVILLWQILQDICVLNVFENFDIRVKFKNTFFKRLQNIDLLRFDSKQDGKNHLKNNHSQISNFKINVPFEKRLNKWSYETWDF